MSGHKYLADTNTFIFLLNQHPSLQGFLDSEWHFSFITEIEPLGKPGISSKEVKNVREMLAACNKIAHSDAIIQLTISLKFRIKLPDALIAATAIYSDLPLLTFDKDFVKIDPLNIVLLEL